MSMIMRQWWIEQEGAAERLALTRYTTGLAMMRATWHLPPGSLFVREGPLLDAAAGRSPRARLGQHQYEALRALSLLSVGAWTLGCEHWAVKAAANLSSAAVHWQNVKFHDQVWNYSSHLHVFMLVLSYADSRGSSRPERPDETGASAEAASAITAALQSYYGWIYFQAGLSKLLGGGARWLDGTTLRGSWAEYGTPLGRQLSKADVRVAAVASAAAVAFELAFFPLLLTGQRRWRLLGLSSLAFHAAVKATMDISFWHLSWHAVPLFIAEPSAEHHVSQVIRRSQAAVRGRSCHGKGDESP